MKDGYTGDLKFDFGNFTLEPTSEVNFNKAAVVLVAGKDGGLDTDAVVTSLNSITLDAAFKGKFDAKLTLTDATFTVDTQSAEIEFESLTASGTASVAVNTSVLVEVEAYGAGTTADVFKPKEGVETNIATDFVADGKAYKTLAEVIAAKPENIKLLKDFEVADTLTIPEGTNVTLDLNGKKVTAATNVFVVEGGLVLAGDGSVTTTKGRVAVAQFGGSVEVMNGTYVSKESAVFQAGSLLDSGVEVKNSKTSKLVIHDGTMTSSEETVGAFADSDVTIEGGTFTANDNLVVMTNGRPSLVDHPYKITINGGTFNGKIQSERYIAGGIYMANKGTVTLNGGVFNITDGVGIVVRSGKLVANKVEINLTAGTRTSGKVGDSQIEITSGSQIVKDLKANYPGGDPEISVNTTGYEVVDIDGNKVTE